MRPAKSSPSAGERRASSETLAGELRDKLDNHARWAAECYDKWVDAKTPTEEKEQYESRRPNLCQSDLRDVDLSRRDLRGAKFSEPFLGDNDLRLKSASNFEGANLTGVKLQGALLRGANLRRAQLYDAHLEGADLCYADLHEAILHRANFAGAALSNAIGLEGDLSDVSLESATGLKGGEFARGRLGGARLPEGIREFSILQAVENTSGSAQTAFLAMLVACLYSWLTIASTTDARLLTNSASSPLPLIQTEVPIAGFYLVAPILLFACFVWLHLYLQDLWQGLAGLPAIFPDGKALDERASPWLLTGLIRPHFKLLREEPRPPLSRLKVGLSILLAWWLLPATLALFWLRYLPRHHGWGAALHVAMLVLATMSAIQFQYLAGLTLQGKLPPTSSPTDDRPSVADQPPTASVHPRGALEQSRRRDSWWLVASGTFLLLLTGLISDGAINGVRSDSTTGAAAHRVIVPAVLPYIGARAFADISEADVSRRPDNWFLAPRGELLDVVNGAHLRDADLRYASAEGAFLDRADLRGAQLQGADLRGAQLKQADLRGAMLQKTDLSQADLHEADLSETDLTEVRGLTQAQLDQACVSQKTKVPQSLELPKAPPQMGADDRKHCPAQRNAAAPKSEGAG